MKRSVRISAGTLVFATVAALVVIISITLDWRQGAADLSVDVPRFSGSTVISGLPSLLPGARLAEPLRVAVVRDDAAAGFYSSPATLDSIVDAWRTALTAIGANARVVRPGGLGSDPAQVLVIPSSPCLTVATRAAIDAATRRGQGVILTGPAGLYDAGCRSIGYGLIVGMTGVARAEVLEPRGLVYVVLPSGGPLSADIPPGSRVELKPAGQIALRDPDRDGYYADYTLQPQPARGKPLLDGALVRATRGNARIVYWGFELRDVVARPWNQAIAQLLVRNSVAWAGRQPLLWVEPWPRGRRMAAVFVQDVETQFANARFALDSLRAAGVPGTFFLTSKLAIHYKRLSRQLAKAGEVGTHSENHHRLGGAPDAIQRARLNLTQRELKRLFGSRVAGLRPPEEQFDTITMAAWLAAGGSYVFGVNDARTAAPELLRVGKDTLVLMGRIGGDDFAVAGPGAARDRSVMTSLFLNDLAQTRALGGLYPFSYHSQLLAREDLVPVLARVARTIATDSTTWAATTGQVADWWRARMALAVATTERDDGFSVVVRNRSDKPVSGAIVRVALPDGRRVIGASTKMLPSEPGIVRLVFPTIAVGATSSQTVRYAVSVQRPPTTVRPHRQHPTYRHPQYRRAEPPWWQLWRRLPRRS